MTANFAMCRKKTIRLIDLFVFLHDNIGKSKVELPSEEDIKKVLNKPIKLPI